MAGITIRGLSKRFGAGTGELAAVAELELDIKSAAPPWECGTLLEEARYVLANQEEGDLMGGPRFEQLFRDALRPALAQFQDPQTGAVTLRNTFRWVAATK